MTCGNAVSHTNRAGCIYGIRTYHMYINIQTILTTSVGLAVLALVSIRGVGEGRAGEAVAPPTFESWGSQPLQFFTSTHTPFLTRPPPLPKLLLPL